MAQKYIVQNDNSIYNSLRDDLETVSTLKVEFCSADYL